MKRKQTSNNPQYTPKKKMRSMVVYFFFVLLCACIYGYIWMRNSQLWGSMGIDPTMLLIIAFATLLAPLSAHILLKRGKKEPQYATFFRIVGGLLILFPIIGIYLISQLVTIIDQHIQQYNNNPTLTSVQVVDYDMYSVSIVMEDNSTLTYETVQGKRSRKKLPVVYDAKEIGKAYVTYKKIVIDTPMIMGSPLTDPVRYAQIVLHLPSK
ncbi:MAG: hypothetical protein ACE3L7_16935 [Candidatus Pristimantibacillus sp.]